ncbi:MAG TPA: lactate racemase domain-containing protein [Kofleriaceae bacterium]|nr:lactate racemase domain-containing protein [Kofleriaceae bacterium]
MGIRLELDYGRRPRSIEVPDGSCIVRAPTPGDDPPPLDHLLATALDHPVDAARLEAQVAAGARVLVVVSDATRAEPRGHLVAAVLARLPERADVTVAVATGTHGPAPLEDLVADLAPTDRRRIAAWVNHDGADRASLVALGTTRRGTPVTVNRAVLDSDVIVATGCIIPHYFAGFGAGCKAIFPGLGGSLEVRINHRLKTEPGSRAGAVEDNPCRADLEDANALLPRPTFLLNAVLDDDGRARAAVAGQLGAAFRAGAALCEPLYRVAAPRCRRIIVSGRGPVTASLYQASKLIAAAAPLLAPGGTIIAAAECEQGIGPLDIVNHGIYEIGIKPRLPRDHRIVLVSGMARDQVERTYCEWAPSVEAALGADPSPVTVLPRASRLLCQVEP